MEVLCITGNVVTGDLEDIFDQFFNYNGTAPKLATSNSAPILSPGEAYFLLGGRRSIVKELRARNNLSVSTSNQSNLSITYKVDIRRVGTFAVTSAKMVKSAIAMPIAAVVAATVLYRRNGDTDFLENAQTGVRVAVNNLERARDKQEYNRKSCVIVQVFNRDTAGNGIPANDNPLISDDITFPTLATQLDYLLPSN